MFAVLEKWRMMRSCQFTKVLFTHEERIDRTGTDVDGLCRHRDSTGRG